ncbi:restriction endonuclease subunit S [Heyndrickxia coagulans]|uniref:restriction endonuclease subunit S n=2 Tax=Bacillaceae TaxID=186817 RepID=UPI001EEE7201|nr:restriction endonuclease subunit S [Heyndrickxia coagulans]
MEELLEEALVPEEEQPYEVRKNYKWVKLGSVISLISGRDVSSKLCNNDGKGIPYIMGASNIIDGKLNVERWIETPTVVGLKGDVLISVKGTVGKTVIQEIEKVHLSRQIMALRCTGIVCNRYLYYYINTYVKQLKENSKGIIPGISREDILNAPFPLASLKEQKRIVDKVERLLSKIDEAKRLIEEAKETFELRRAAILDKAFRGKLGTNNPSEKSLEGGNSERNLPIEEQPYEIPQNWLWVSLNAIAKFINGDRGKNYPSQKDFVHEGIPFINAGHLVNGKIKMSDMNYISEEKFNSLGSGKVCNNDILYCLRGTLGKTAIVEGIEKGAIASSLVILRPYQNVNNEFLYYYLISTLGQSMIKIHDNGSAQPNLSASNVKKYIFPLPPLAEQKRIVEKLNHVIGNMENEQFAIDKALEELEQLKNVILSKAFRGELGTNDPTEESAIELLKEVLKEQVK